jgi:hypothetical protein
MNENAGYILGPVASSNNATAPGLPPFELLTKVMAK